MMSDNIVNEVQAEYVFCVSKVVWNTAFQNYEMRDIRADELENFIPYMSAPGSIVKEFVDSIEDIKTMEDPDDISLAMLSFTKYLE